MMFGCQLENVSLTKTITKTLEIIRSFTRLSADYIPSICNEYLYKSTVLYNLGEKRRVDQFCFNLIDWLL